MANDLHNLGLPAGTNLAVQPLKQIQSTANQLPAPALVTNAVVPEVLSSKRRDGVLDVTDEAAGGVGVHAQEKGNEQVMGVPEGLEGLLSDPGMCRGVNQEHAEQHDVTSNATSLGVVDFEGDLGTDLGLLDVVEAEVV
jgi:hypothetical protein